MENLPLKGTRILDFSWVYTGPLCTRILAGLGAEVIKVESKARPDLANRGGNFYELNTNKKSVTLNLKEPGALELVKGLVKASDVIVENFAAGVMERLGLGYEVLKEVKPDIIFVASSGLGKTGPDRAHVAYGRMIQCFALWTSMIGRPDQRPDVGNVWTDLLTGTTEAYLVMAALYQCHQTGQGQYLDLSMSETTLCALPEPIMAYTMNGEIMRGQGNRDEAIAPYGVYRCRGKDQWVAIEVRNEEEWGGLCQALGNPGWCQEERYADPLSRWHHQDELDERIEAWTKERTHVEAMEHLQKHGVPAGAAYHTRELVEDAHLKSRGLYLQLEKPGRGRITTVGLPWTTEDGRLGQFRPAPDVGEHSREVLGSILGLSDEEIDQLIEAKVIF